MTITIWGKNLQNNKVEKVDHASNPREASYLCGEYQMAFGRDWVIWAGRKMDEPKVTYD